ncbi:G-protein coupled receptor 98 [Heterocephalus glaber]|uniref:G-protein coupled receptor 98 n=1 Tax=Heterocephalus glaber TaxID=10181 RepID=G5ASQ5_HETGA|nr:G-protein coupled receptor 98 [Heterocephalus glaber]
MNGHDRFTGVLQDVRAYERKLTLEEIYEFHAMPAKDDLHPISGYLEFRQGETNKSFIVSARDDNEEEGEELFILKLVSVYGGAHISEDNSTARLVIQKSDNANGLFGFTRACIPEVSSELRDLGLGIHFKWICLRLSFLSFGKIAQATTLNPEVC